MAKKVSDPNEAERYHLGATIAGRYRVERPIGEGAMGVVALARHVSLDETVAVKFLRPEQRRDPVAIARLWREAKALARIRSDHVARVLDMGVTLSVGPYMVMEYLEGTDLGALIATEGPLPVERAVEVVLQVCEGLTVAHTAGITHRDIKPQNLFLSRHGQFETLKILDFGIADDDTGARGQGTVSAPGQRGAALPRPYGTPSYMSPERIRNEAAADHRADIWSVGVVLHELITGRAVFDGATLTETCARVLSGAPVALDRRDGVLPPALRSIIARCLEREPHRRYQSVEELAAALAPLGTMQERFRGRSTGAFTRLLVEDQRALYDTRRWPLPPPSATPPTPPTPVDLSTVLSELGAALSSGARTLPVARVYDRPLWLYAAVAVASGLAVVLLTEIFGDMPWLAPRSATTQAAPLQTREGRSIPTSVAAAPADVLAPADLVAPPSRARLLDREERDRADEQRGAPAARR